MDQHRHADVVVVPDVVGMTMRGARQIASEAGLALAQPDPDGPPLGALIWLTTEQHPSPGSQVHRWNNVRVHVRSADGDGTAGRENPDDLSRPRMCSLPRKTSTMIPPESH